MKITVFNRQEIQEKKKQNQTYIYILEYYRNVKTFINQS